MELTAVFENWHIGDGKYPPLCKDQLVNLSFELEPSTFAKANQERAREFVHLGNAEYHFCGNVLKVYDGDFDGEIVIVETSDFLFYVVSRDIGRYDTGDVIIGVGALLLDLYIWVENLNKYENPPDLSYRLRVQQIRKVQTPERFIARDKDGKSFPCRLAPDDYTDSDVDVIETMEGQPFDEEFYIIDLDSDGVEDEKITRTFLG